MAIYKYERTVPLGENENASLKISLGQLGTAAHHYVDVPVSADKQGLDACTIEVGAYEELKAERTIITTNAVNVNPQATEIAIDYDINSVTVNHVNSKSTDPAPQIKIKIMFIKK